VTLTEFLLARIAEDEALAQDQLRAYQHVFGIPHYFRIDQSIVGLTPRTALAECEAKRRIVGLWDLCMSEPEPGFPSAPLGGQGAEVYYDALRALAVPYADHPSFRAEWAI